MSCRPVSRFHPSDHSLHAEVLSSLRLHILPLWCPHLPGCPSSGSFAGFFFFLHLVHPTSLDLNLVCSHDSQTDVSGPGQRSVRLPACCLLLCVIQATRTYHGQERSPNFSAQTCFFSNPPILVGGWGVGIRACCSSQSPQNHG